MYNRKYARNARKKIDLIFIDDIETREVDRGRSIRSQKLFYLNSFVDPGATVGARYPMRLDRDVIEVHPRFDRGYPSCVLPRCYRGAPRCLEVCRGVSRCIEMC